MEKTLESSKIKLIENVVDVLQTQRRNTKAIIKNGELDLSEVFFGHEFEEKLLEKKNKQV